MIDCLNICISSFLPDVKLFAAPAQKILFLTSIEGENRSVQDLGDFFNLCEENNSTLA
jgi:hypothetical protein